MEEKDKQVEEQEVEIRSEETSEVVENDTNMDETTAKLAEMQDKYLRLAAEFDNYRKRTLKEKYELIKTAGEDVIKDILPIIDDFDRALDAIKKSGNVEALAEGVNLIYEKLTGSLKTKGLTEIEAIGKEFDPEIYEAVAKCPAPEEMKGKILDVVQKGYKLNEKVIRFPKVVVGE